MRHLVEAARLGEAIEVDSAGTGDWHVGELPDERMRKAGSRRGYEFTHRARQIKVADFDAFDLIVTMDQANLRDVQTLALTAKSPRAEIRSFHEFCRKIRVAKVPDPYFGGPEGFEEVLDILEDGCTVLLQALRS